VWVGVAVVAALLVAGAAAGAWWGWRRWLQFCPHCGWIVRRVQRGWLRCPRCHKQYARHAKLRPH
jgi:NADH pyrophosphatase NudC (nudix superfamily)